MKKKYWVAVYADFCCVNIPTMADFKLPTWSWEEMHTVDARARVSSRPPLLLSLTLH